MDDGRRSTPPPPSVSPPRCSLLALATPDDARALVAALDRIDYVVETSDRVTGALPQVPARYATTLRYYDALRDGRLGFEHVASFRSGPSLFGLDLDDSASEESFRVYDHPPVDIWRKTDAFDVERALALIQPDRALADEDVPLKEAGANGLLQREEADRPATGPTFDEVFGDRLPFPALWWWLWWSVAAWAALPWTTRLLRALPDRGWGLTKVIGPLALLIPLWFTVAVGIVPFARWSVALATAIAVAAGAWSWWRHRDDADRDVVARALPLAPDRAGAGVAHRLRRRWGCGRNPDLWFPPTGGEKPMPRTSPRRAVGHVPPPDPWFSGGVMTTTTAPGTRWPPRPGCSASRPMWRSILAVATAALAGGGGVSIGAARPPGRTSVGPGPWPRAARRRRGPGGGQLHERPPAARAPRRRAGGRTAPASTGGR